jgi:putative aldouronate transport system substrate-binding protein
VKKRLLGIALVVTVLLAAAIPASAEIEPFGEGKTLTFSCLEGWYSAVSINDVLPVWKEFERRTGAVVEFEAFGDYNAAMQPRVAAGQDLPDIMLIPPAWGNSGVYRLATDGLIIPIDELITEHAPNIVMLLDANPALKGLLTAPDGSIYTVADAPMFVNDMVVNNAMFIRQDWLDALGLPVPVTIEDWYETLVAFKSYDSTGTGKETVPFSGMQATRIFAGIFTGGFGMPIGADKGWWYDEDGHVENIYISDTYKDYLTEIAKWYDEGLIDMESTRDESNFQSLVATNVVGSFSTLAEYITLYNNMLETSGVVGKFSLIAPPALDGKQLQIVKRDPTWNHYGITKFCKDPELAIKWIDYVWGSDEGVTLNEWGFLGETYDIDENGNKYYTDLVLNNPDGLDPYNTLRNLGGSNTILVRTPAEVFIALMQGSPSVDYGATLQQFRVEPFPQVMGTDDEQKIIDRIQPDLDTYFDESIAKFINGSASLDEFDDYIATVMSIGYEELRDVKQAQFDRSGR